MFLSKTLPHEKNDIEEYLFKMVRLCGDNYSYTYHDSYNVALFRDYRLWDMVAYQFVNWLSWIV